MIILLFIINLYLLVFTLLATMSKNNYNYTFYTEKTSIFTNIWDKIWANIALFFALKKFLQTQK